LASWCFACLNLFKANPPTCHNTIFFSRHQRGNQATAAISDRTRGCWQVEQRNLPYNYNRPRRVGWRHGVFACLNLFKANPPMYYNTIFFSRYREGAK